MGVTPEQLARVYPKLYHMAEAETWDSIKRHGLLCTSALLDLLEVDEVTRTPMNTGNTKPYAYPRIPETFKRMTSYPFKERAKYGRNRCVVELAVEGGVPDIGKVTLSADEMSCASGNGELVNNIFKR